MTWEVGQRYRGRAVPGQVQVEKAKNGTPSALVLIEVNMGPNQGQRLRWRGYLNSSENAEKSAYELRAMGWRGARLGDWAGIGTVDVEFSCMADVGEDGKTYYRAAFVRPVAAVNKERAVDAAALDELNARLSGAIAHKPNGTAPGPSPSPASETPDEIPF